MEKNADFMHNQSFGITASIREVVFGVEDGIISTLGVLVGIAAGTNDHFVVIVSGLVVIVVESISMGVGSYLSSKSVREVDEHRLKEERVELREDPEAEKRELVGLYVKDGWPQDLANEMALKASENRPLFLREMAYRELLLHPRKLEKPLQGGVFMFFSYIIGGIIPLLPYFVLPIPKAILLSSAVAFAGLFALGCVTTRFTKRHWAKAGAEMVLVAGIAALVGYLVGMAADYFL